jgi:hypothetical protein
LARAVVAGSNLVAKGFPLKVVYLMEVIVAVHTHIIIDKSNALDSLVLDFEAFFTWSDFILFVF